VSLNADKTQYMEFVTNTKFLGLTLDNTFSWKNHIDTVVPKLSSACFTVRAVKPFLSHESLRMVYFSCFHSTMTYGLVFCGNSYYSNTVFKLQKRLELLSGLETESHAENISENYYSTVSIYILTLIFVTDNRHFKIYSDIHNINTRNNLDLHYPSFVSLPEGCTLYWD
jgi:hypothetical protein